MPVATICMVKNSVILIEEEHSRVCAFKGAIVLLKGRWLQPQLTDFDSPTHEVQDHGALL